MFRDDEKVTYFGLGLEDSFPAKNRAYALQVLAGAVGRCYEEDVRTDEVRGAVAYLRRGMVRPVLADRFIEALDIPDSGDRVRAAAAALRRLKDGVEG